MKLNKEYVGRQRRELGIKYGQMAMRLFVGSGALKLMMKKGFRIGDSAVKEIYNAYGEEETVRLIDFEEGNIDNFKAKYLQVGTQLF